MGVSGYLQAEKLIIYKIRLLVPLFRFHLAALISPCCISVESKSELHCIESKSELQSKSKSELEIEAKLEFKIWHRSKTSRSSVGSTLPPHEEEHNAYAFKSTFEAPSEVASASEAADPGGSQATVVCEAAYRNPGGKSGGDDYDKESHDFKRGVNETASECPKCKLSRWKVDKDGREKCKIQEKVMWYFSIILRLNGCLKSSLTTELLTWQSNQRIHDGQMHHLADSPSWRNIDYRWPDFGSNNLDEFLQPLVDDLKKLWEEGEPNVYDTFTKTYFTLRATLLWMINNFPTYGNLSGCVNKGYLGCPVCGDDTVANYLPYSRKICYQGHRRYLPRHHSYKKKKVAFSGQQEFGQPRQPLYRQEVLEQKENIKFSYGKKVKKSKKVDCAWKKKSVFFELEYWKFYHVRHYLDIMHVEKNVCDSLIGTLLNLKFKSKDSEAYRLDMMEMGVRTDLAPEIGEKRTYLPPSGFTLTKAEKIKVSKSLSSMKFPYGHSPNIRNCVSMANLKIFGMKSHDYASFSTLCATRLLTYQNLINCKPMWLFADLFENKVMTELNKKVKDCDRGVKIDELGFTLVDLSRQGHKNVKYLPVDQVKQVFYVEDPVDSNWSVVLTSTTRDYHEI
ncbi:hypothetical protein AgCh_003604 [Apium graveolens]